MSISIETLERRKRELESSIGYCKDNLRLAGERFIEAQEHLIKANSDLISLNDELLKVRSLLS